MLFYYFNNRVDINLFHYQRAGYHLLADPVYTKRVVTFVTTLFPINVCVDMYQ